MPKQRTVTSVELFGVELDMIRAAAEDRGLTLGAFIRQCVLAVVEKKRDLKLDGYEAGRREANKLTMTVWREEQEAMLARVLKRTAR